MECSGFMLADSGRSGSSRIMIVGSSHKSSSRNVLLPLVGRGLGQLNPKMNEWVIDVETRGGGLVEREDIIGVGLSFDSTHFPLGSGPLFSFAEKSLSSGSEIGMVGETSTELRTSDILNVTSSSGDGSLKKLRSCVTERVVGSRISGSTNHDMGTGLCGRLGGSIVCVNSSFSSCVRTSNAIIDKKHENLTTDDPGRIFVEITLGIPSMKFSLCTFNEMTFATGLGAGGAAISTEHAHSALTVTQCFFHKCTSTMGRDGAAIYVNEFYDDCPVTLSLSSFAACEVTGFDSGFGGSVSCASWSLFSVSDCFFEKSCSQFDGAIHLDQQPLVILSNSAFVSCSSVSSAGALGISRVEAIDMSFLQFRECRSTQTGEPQDILITGTPSPVVDSDTVRYCDSTSGEPNVYVFTNDPSTGDRSYLVPELKSTPTLKVSVSFSGETATVTATAGEGIKGTMGILLNGSNVPRLVHVQFGSDTEASTSGSAIVSSGDHGILPQATYELRTSSFATNCFLPSSLHAAHSSLKDRNTTSIVLHGINLEEGSYLMLIRNGDNTLNISLTRTDSTTLVGEAPHYSLEASGRLELETE
ncbi:hypothetical protein BLNAU_14398 [Blattamonas nauphoetae]|uniref:Uncharacterized protein n=1 Tax=Blattamonas nauphoetae TaxID=2049346 RepID=A0ABQ9XJF8_9EUKA|nr:hypothetical protein BLNAU_14398 [Blattamonas nauphoetae]